MKIFNVKSGVEHISYLRDRSEKLGLRVEDHDTSTTDAIFLHLRSTHIDLNGMPEEKTGFLVVHSTEEWVAILNCLEVVKKIAW